MKWLYSYAPSLSEIDLHVECSCLPQWSNSLQVAICITDSGVVLLGPDSSCIGLPLVAKSEGQRKPKESGRSALHSSVQPCLLLGCSPHSKPASSFWSCQGMSKEDGTQLRVAVSIILLGNRRVQFALSALFYQPCGFASSISAISLCPWQR